MTDLYCDGCHDVMPHVFEVDGQMLCPDCFREWVLDNLDVYELADAMEIPNGPAAVYE